MNGRLYDPVLGRMLSPDPYIQMLGYAQNYNRYSYVLNNPLKFTDPSGEFIFTAIVVGFIVNAAIDYGMQVAFNYIAGHRGKDAWFGKVDFFDVAISGIVGGATAGFGSAVNAGKNIPKIGSFVLNNAGFIKAGEIALTSAIDITGEGYQKVSGGQFIQRVAIAGTTWGASEMLKGAFKPKAPTASVTNSTVEMPKLDEPNIGITNPIQRSEVVDVTGTGQLDISPNISKPQTFVRQGSGDNVKWVKEFKYTDKQRGDKFGEHLNKNWEGYRNPNEYIEYAKRIFHDPNSIVTKFGMDAPLYRGETHYILNGHLLRMNSNGEFRSLYPIISKLR